MSARRTVVVFTPGGGHAQRLLPLIAILVKRGLEVHVMTRPDAHRHIEAAGAVFHDLFARYPLHAVDNESIPMPSRLVTFAAAYAEALSAEVAQLRPALLVYDSFEVVAPVIARRLAVPYVSMRAGHAQAPAQAIDEIRRDPRVMTSAACHEAVDRLRGEYGMSGANPFSYLDGVSPYFNLYPEPPQFLDERVRQAFEPMAFFGSLAPDIRDSQSQGQPLFSGRGNPRVYVSFGTAIWRYFTATALSTLESVASVFSARDAEVLIGLGNHQVDAGERRQIERRHVRVETYVDQWQALKSADLFVTHHGLNSTHEAIFHLVPMLSCPFFGDQPAMAERCQSLGLALALTNAPRAALDPSDVHRQVDVLELERESVMSRLTEARRWEMETIDGREAVVDRMLALA